MLSASSAICRMIAICAFVCVCESCGARGSLDLFNVAENSTGGAPFVADAGGGQSSTGAQPSTGGGSPSGGASIVDGALPHTCLEILNAGDSIGDGYYEVDQDGDGAPGVLYCDMTFMGGGFSRCLSFINTEAEDLTDPFWLDSCIDSSMSFRTGNEVLIKLLGPNGELIYAATGTRSETWEYEGFYSGFDEPIRHESSAIKLSTGDFLVLISRYGSNGGCYGGWRSDYQIQIKAPLVAFGVPQPDDPPSPWPFLSVVPYRYLSGSTKGEPRTFWNTWSSQHEITFWPEVGTESHRVPDPCSESDAPAHLGSFEFYVR